MTEVYQGSGGFHVGTATVEFRILSRYKPDILTDHIREGYPVQVTPVREEGNVTCPRHLVWNGVGRGWAKAQPTNPTRAIRVCATYDMKSRSVKCFDTNTNIKFWRNLVEEVVEFTIRSESKNVKKNDNHQRKISLSLSLGVNGL